MPLLVRIARYLSSILAFVYVPAAVLCAGLCILLLVVAETTSSRLVAGAALLLLPLPTVAYSMVFIRARIHVVVASGVALVVAAFLLLASYMITPNGETPSGSPIRSVFLNEIGYCRASVANLVPEIDQLKLGSYIIPALDPFIDRQQSGRIRALFLKVYREMRESAEYESLGSVMNYAYRDMLTATRPCPHFYMYVPAAIRGKAVPLIVFLHGSGGNFKGYMWNWKHFAEANGVVVVAPSFGFGCWDRDGAPELLQKVLHYLDARTEFTVARRYLVGLSNGGIGAYRLGTSMDESFDGLVLISPVMQSRLYSEEEFVATWRSRPLLVVHGANDRRIPIEYVKRRCRGLLQGGVRLRTEFIGGEDHFLMFSSWDRVEAVLKSWLEETDSSNKNLHADGDTLPGNRRDSAMPE